MRYYRITFSKPVNMNGPKWNWSYDWYDLVCTAQNADEAREHGKKVAADNGLLYCCTYNLPRVEGLGLIQRSPALQKTA